MKSSLIILVAAVTLIATQGGFAAEINKVQIDVNFNSMSLGYLPGGADTRTPGNGQWWVPDNAATYGKIVQGPGMYGTKNLLEIGNRGNGNDGVIQNVTSPRLSTPAGESSVAANNVFNSWFWFRTAPTTPTAGYALKIETWGTDRNTWLGFTSDGANGNSLTASVNSTDATGQFVATTIGTNLDWGQWYYVGVKTMYRDGANNNTVTYTISGADMLNGDYGTSITVSDWEQYYRLDSEQAFNGNQISAVDAIGFQARGSVAGATAYIDNPHYYSAFDATLTPEPATMSLLALGGLALIRRRK